MLQLVLSIALCFVAFGAQAQGVVTSMQRPGTLPQPVLDKLVTLEAQYADLNGIITGYNTYVVNNPNGCGASQVYSGTCRSLPAGQRLVEVASALNSNDGSAFSALGDFWWRAHDYLNNNGCSPTASGTPDGWSICTLDQLRQAHTLRLTDYNVGTSVTGWFFPLEPGYIVLTGSPPTSAGAANTSCYTMMSTDEYGAVMTMNSSTRNATFSSCGAKHPVLCCRVE